MTDDLIEGFDTELLSGGLIEEIAAAARRHRVFITLSVGTSEDIVEGVDE